MKNVRLIWKHSFFWM